MPSVAYQFAYRRVAMVHRVVEKWQIDHLEAQMAFDVDQMVTETAGLVKPVSRLANDYRDGIRPDSSPEDVVAAHRVGFLIAETLRIFDRVRNRIGKVREKGYQVESLDEFDRANQELSNMNIEFTKKWLRPDEKTVNAAKADLAAGRFRKL